jgi:hypothetical protein
MPFFIQTHVATGSVRYYFIFVKAVAYIIIVAFDGDPNPFPDVIWNFVSIFGEA